MEHGRWPRRPPALVADLEAGRLGSAPAQELVLLLQEAVNWWKAGLLSDEARGRRADALVRALPAGAPGIVGGDFNTWRGQTQPAWRLLARRFDETPTARTPTFADRLVLDHVFVDLPEGWYAATRVVDDTYRPDHHPVLTVVHSAGACLVSASSRAAAR